MWRESLLKWRGLVFGAVCVLGWLAPWNYATHLDGSGPNAHLWGVLSVALSKTGAVSIGLAFELVLAVGILLAVAGALLRTMAAARGGERRWYAGTVLHGMALALLMPVSGAVFAVALVAGLAWVLRGGAGPAGWARAAMSEVYAWGVAGSFAVAGWWYNADLLVRCVLVCAGVGLVVRGLVGPAADVTRSANG